MVANGRRHALTPLFARIVLCCTLEISSPLSNHKKKKKKATVEDGFIIETRQLFPPRAGIQPECGEWNENEGPRPSSHRQGEDREQTDRKTETIPNWQNPAGEEKGARQCIYTRLSV